MTDQEQPQRRHPAHHEPVQRFNEPVIVQVNVCTKDRRPVLTCEVGHRRCREAWQAADFWRVGQYMIMPDHIHLFCRPGRVPMSSLVQWVEYWKSRIALRWSGGSPFAATVLADGTEPDGAEAVPPGERMGIGGSGSVRTGKPGRSDVEPFKLWQRDFWDTQMRSREHYEEKLYYVRMNPVRKELVKTPEEWPYQGVIHETGWL